MTQEKQLTWLQSQIVRSEWDNLNARRLALKVTWADILVPAAKDYIAKLEGTPAGASAEAPASTTTTNSADKTTRARKTKRAKKAPAIAEVK